MRRAGEVVRVYVPKVYPPIRISAPLQSLLFTVGGITLALVAWGVLTVRSTGNQSERVLTPLFDWTEVQSAAFLFAGENTDSLVIHTPSTDEEPRVLATFERNGDVPARGLASPTANRIAVVQPRNPEVARLSIVHVNDGGQVTSTIAVDANSHLSWTRDGAAVAATASSAKDASGRADATILLINARTGEAQPVATFGSALRAAPVGFSLDGRRLFVVVIDPSGSSLWSIDSGEPTQVATLSSGRTRDWALSPDGTMLAYIEVRSGASVPTVGKAVFTATGAPIPVSDNATPQEGVTWRPGATMPGFGGPGGTLRLFESNGDSGTYVIPESWSPDGVSLVARVVKPSHISETSVVTWEVLTAPDASPPAAAVQLPARTIIYEGPAEVTFLGWVRNAPTFPADVKE